MKLPHDSLAGTLATAIALTVVLYLVTGAWIRSGLS